ncbi:SDR family oxidoreductase [Micromonospora craniellae]|uniref:SDR family oxidoreductase n=1 Tax=Micromonospora craniellae TaxID=2294034 RepID=UPI0037C7CC4F
MPSAPPGRTCSRSAAAPRRWPRPRPATGQRAWPGSALYAAGKAALDSLTRSWAVELAPRGVRVVAVAPGAGRQWSALFQSRPSPTDTSSGTESG